MGSDREVLREIWDGKIPVCFQLDSEEIEGLRVPDPCYILVPRLSYFPLITDKVRKQFSKFIHNDKQDAEIWLDYNGFPLKWHFPIGLLYDIYSTFEGIVLPWNITVHFSKYPDKELMRCPSKDVVESYFMSSMKEADVLKHKSPIFSTMQKKDHVQLWLGLQNDKFDQFWAVNRKLMDSSGNTVEDSSFKYIPIRWYMSDEGFLQKLIRPAEDNQKLTVQHLIAKFCPDADLAKIRLVTHGIDLPTETPLQWLSEHLSYPDNFLHIVCKTS